MYAVRIMVGVIDAYLLLVRWMLLHRLVSGRVALPILLQIRKQRERLIHVAHS